MKRLLEALAGDRAAQVTRGLEHDARPFDGRVMKAWSEAQALGARQAGLDRPELAALFEQLDGAPLLVVAARDEQQRGVVAGAPDFVRAGDAASFFVLNVARLWLSVRRGLRAGREVNARSGRPGRGARGGRRRLGRWRITRPGERGDEERGGEARSRRGVNEGHP